MLINQSTYRVPYLQFDDLSVNFEGVRPELYPNGDLVFLFELVVHDPFHEARLADARVTNQRNLEPEVVVIVF